LLHGLVFLIPEVYPNTADRSIKKTTTFLESSVGCVPNP
jgi:hypothetical protein